MARSCPSGAALCRCPLLTIESVILLTLPKQALSARPTTHVAHAKSENVPARTATATGAQDAGSGYRNCARLLYPALAVSTPRDPASLQFKSGACLIRTAEPHLRLTLLCAVLA